jgi:hypothetical protein
VATTSELRQVEIRNMYIRGDRHGRIRTFCGGRETQHLGVSTTFPSKHYGLRQTLKHTVERQTIPPKKSAQVMATAAPNDVLTVSTTRAVASPNIPMKIRTVCKLDAR